MDERMDDGTNEWNDASWRPLLYVTNEELEGKHENNNKGEKWGKKIKMNEDESE
jgi:hypothetical protein